MHFSDRTDAGRKLAEKLTIYLGKDVIVYGLPRGGVVTAYEVAKLLHAPLDLIITRKIGHPHEPEYAIAAVSENGKIVENKRELQNVNHEWFEQEIKEQHAEIQRRRNLYLKDRKPLDVNGKIAILVDDGIATGLTMEAAIKDIKHRHPRKIIVAVPVVPFDIAKKLEKKVDDFVALDNAKYFLGGIGAYYEDFPQVTDQEVIYLLSNVSVETSPRFMFDPLLFTFQDYSYISEYLLENLSNFHEGKFSLEHFRNNEMHTSINTYVSGKYCFVLGTVAPPDENLLSFLLLCHTLKNEGAKSITALLPYLAYSRHDKRTFGRSLGTAWIGQLLKASGINHVITLDVHSKNIHKLFPIPVTSLSPANVFAQEIQKLPLSNYSLVAPDEGAKSRCEEVANYMGIKQIAIFKKKRISEEITHLGLEGNVSKQVVIIDDMLDTGKTLLSCIKYLQENGVEKIYIFVTHGLFTGSLWKELFNLGVEKIYCTDTIPLSETVFLYEKISTLSILPVLSSELKKHMENFLGIRNEVKISHLYV